MLKNIFQSAKYGLIKSNGDNFLFRNCLWPVLLFIIGRTPLILHVWILIPQTFKLAFPTSVNHFFPRLSKSKLLSIDGFNLPKIILLKFAEKSYFYVIFSVFWVKQKNYSAVCSPTHNTYTGLLVWYIRLFGIQAKISLYEQPSSTYKIKQDDIPNALYC